MFSKFSILVILAVVFFSCEDKKEGSYESYEGPMAIGHDIEVLYSEFGNKKITLEAPEQHQYSNSDQEFPSGMFMNFYNLRDNKKPYGDLRADFAHYYAALKYWKLTGNVVYRDILKKEELEAKVMYWRPSDRKMWSDDTVFLTAPGRELIGDGMEALDDFTWYKILKPRGRRQKL